MRGNRLFFLIVGAAIALSACGGSDVTVQVLAEGADGPIPQANLEVFFYPFDRDSVFDALDTEADSMHNYPEKVCLIQLSIRGSHYLVDPLSGLDLQPLGPLLRDPGVTKILHGADYDLRVLQRDFGFVIQGLFDTMVAARLVGEDAVGLAALLAIALPASALALELTETALVSNLSSMEVTTRPVEPPSSRMMAMSLTTSVELAVVEFAVMA